jgi:hypothetical protein
LTIVCSSSWTAAGSGWSMRTRTSGSRVAVAGMVRRDVWISDESCAGVSCFDCPKSMRDSKPSTCSRLLLWRTVRECSAHLVYGKVARRMDIGSDVVGSRLDEFCFRDSDALVALRGVNGGNHWPRRERDARVGTSVGSTNMLCRWHNHRRRNTWGARRGAGCGHRTISAWNVGVGLACLRRSIAYAPHRSVLAGDAADSVPVAPSLMAGAT